MVMTSMEVDKLRKWQAGHAQALDQIHQTRAAWKELAPVVDEKDYPLELLREVTQSIPLDQLHLTTFAAGDGKLTVTGEAKNVTDAFQFFRKLKSDPYFSSYGLTMANPSIKQNDLAQFQIEGSHAATN